MPKKVIKPDSRLKLGQHFMTDIRYLDKICQNVPFNSAVIEIGAGSGLLTSRLAKRAKKLTAVEIDPKLKIELAKVKQKNRNVEIVINDALSEEITDLVIKLSNQKPLFIVSNLPYHITEPFIFKAARWQKPMILTVGKRFGLTSQLTEADQEYFSTLSFVSRSFFKIVKIADVPKIAFSPPPSTDSMLLKFTPKVWPLNLSDFLGQFAVKSKKGMKIKNILIEGIIAYYRKLKLNKTKNDARKIINNFGLNDSLLEKNFSMLTNIEVKILTKKIDSL